MNSNRRHRILRGLGALFTLAALSVGIPVVLSLVGSPLPQELPTLKELWAGFTAPTLTDTLILKAVVLVGWLAWAWMLLMLGRELLARIGLVNSKLTATNPMQRLVAELVTAVLLLLPSAPRVIATLPIMTTSIASVAVADVASAGASEVKASPVMQSLDSGGLSEESPAAEVSESSPTSSTYRVKAGDSLWDIADDQLHDPAQWSEIYEQNKDRHFGQRVFSDPDLIHPGWDLNLPGKSSPQGADAAEASQVPPTPNQEETSVATPLPQTAPPAAAEQGHGHVVPMPSVVTGEQPSPTSVAPPSTTVVPPTRHDVGSRLPATAVPLPRSIAELPVVRGPEDAPKRATTPTTSIESAAGDETDDQGPVELRVVTVGSGLLAAGLASLYRRRRNNQRRHRHFGRRLRPVPREAGPLVAAISYEEEAGQEDAEFLDRALRVLRVALAVDSQWVPRILGAELSTEALTLWHLDAAHAVPAPFSVDSQGRWVLKRDLELEPPDVPAPLPTLVEVGRVDNAYSLANLEELRYVSLAGDEERCRALLRSLLLDLGTHDWADQLEVLTVGLEVDLESVGRVVTVDSVEEAVEYLEVRSQEIHHELTALGVTSPLGARLLDDELTATPAVFLCAAPLSVTQASRLRVATELTGGAVAVVLGDQSDAPHRWVLDDKPLTVAKLIAANSVSAVSSEVFAASDALLADAVDTSDAPVQTLPLLTVVGSESSEDEEEIASLLAAWIDPVVTVNVLGPLTFSGLSQSFGPDHVNIDRELLTCLALHPSGLSDIQLKRYVWGAGIGDRRISAQTLQSAMSRVRSVLGRNQGERLERLPRKAGDKYRIGEGVGTDWSRFQQLVALGYRRGPTGAEDLLSALGLVRGVPFTDVHLRYSWLHPADDWAFANGGELRAESFPDEMTRAVQDAAKAAVDLCLEYDRIDDAHFAIDQGLKVDRSYERLEAQRMRVFASTGDVEAVEMLFAELVQSRHKQGSGRSDLLTETLVLYEQCRQVKRTRASS